jgi:hypothetical protein
MWLIKHHIINLYGEWRHNSTHFNDCCRCRWAVMLCSLPHRKNPNYLFNKLDWPQGQYRCHSKEISLHRVYDGFLLSLGIYAWSVKCFHSIIEIQLYCYSRLRIICWAGSQLVPNYSQKMSLCYSMCQHFHKTQYDLLCVQKSLSYFLAKWLATAVPLAIRYAAASSSNIHELLLFSVKCELWF